jgi:rod shape-determining protein MreD
VSEAAGCRTWVILASLAAALFLSVLPMPAWGEDLRPQWVAMALIYWSLAVPERVGVFWAWGTGLVLDVTSGTVLGQHTLSLSVVAWLTVELHKRIRVFPPVQQAVSVWVLLLVERLLSMWVMGATGQPTPSLRYWLAPFVGMLLWPWVFVVLRDLRQRFAVS